MQRLHAMPFGTTLLSAGGVRFRLWAPAAQQVLLCTAGKEWPMRALSEQWFELDLPEATVGQRYSYRLDGSDLCVPDPASRFQPADVHAPSEVIDPTAWHWTDTTWQGRPWEEAVFYELHVGTFSPTGDFQGVMARLDALQELGITAIELMPVADFPGRWNWGYDGVLLFAPDHRYGRPEDLKALVQAAHARGMMVFLDVVYNHFGPEGNYLYGYAWPFFTARYHTPWGDAINFEGTDAQWVRQFFIHNALYWLEEFHFDGLRLDAVHAITDHSPTHFLAQLAQAVQAGPGQHRLIHLVLENDHNFAHWLQRDGASGRPVFYTAQWNDDLHHALHVLGTGEKEGYYADYADHPLRHLGRCLTEGFAYQGETSVYRQGALRGEVSAHLPPAAFIGFLQNHDQIGNRALGERLSSLIEPAALRALTAILLLAPSPPLLFMGQEWATQQPFLFFCDFGADLAQAVTAGRRREFARFPAFCDPDSQARIPDPQDSATFTQSQLNWHTANTPEAQAWRQFHQHLLQVRRDKILPILPHLLTQQAHYHCLNAFELEARWPLKNGGALCLRVNLHPQPGTSWSPPAHLLSVTPLASAGAVPPWFVAWGIAAPSEGNTHDLSNHSNGHLSAAI